MERFGFEVFSSGLGGILMKSNWYRKLYEWAWGAGERCYVGKMRSKNWWKKNCRKTTRRKLKDEGKVNKTRFGC